jgi:hypothetical protein
LLASATVPDKIGPPVAQIFLDSSSNVVFFFAATFLSPSSNYAYDIFFAPLVLTAEKIKSISVYPTALSIILVSFANFTKDLPSISPLPPVKLSKTSLRLPAG